MADHRRTVPAVPPVAELAGARPLRRGLRARARGGLARAHRRAEPELNAFVDVFARRGARGRRRDRRPATSARSPACRSRSRTTAPVAGKRLTFARRLHGRLRSRRTTTTSSRRLRAAGLRHRRHDDAARVGHPARRPRRGASARRATRGTSTARRAARRAARRPRSPPGMVPDRPRQRRRRLDADPGRVLRARRPQAAARPHLARARARRAASSATDGVLTRTRRRDRRAARRPRRATSWATRRGRRRRPSRSPRAAAREPGACAIARHRRAAARRADRPGRARGRARRRRRCSSRSATRSRRPTRRGAGRELLRARSPRCFGPARAARRSRSARWSPAASPAEDDMEPLSWALWQLVQGDRRALDAHAGAGPAPGLRRARSSRGCDELRRRSLTPALAEAPVLARRRSTADATTRWATFARSAAFTPFTAIAQRHRPAGDLAAAVRARRRPAARRPAHRPRRRGRARCWRSRRSSRPRGRGRSAAGAGA